MGKFTLALRCAIKTNRRDAHNRYLQLATVRADGSPAVRTVVFRDFQDGPARLLMVTDARSAKAEEVQHNLASEACWYFSHTREQFRLRGTLSLEADGSQRDRIWDALSDAARAQFYWPSPAATPVDPVPEITAGELAEAPAHFLLAALEIRMVDHLQLRGSPQRRWLSQRCDDHSWSVSPVNP